MKTGLKTLIAGVVVFVVGVFVLPIAWILPLILAEKEETQFVVPGTAVIEIGEPGRYYLWNDHRTVFEGKSFNRSEHVPDGLEISVVNEAGESFEFVSDTSISSNSGSSSRTSIGYVEIAKPERVTVVVSGSSGERVFSFSEFHLVGILKQFLGVFALILLAAVSGIGLAIWGILKLVRSSKSEEKP